MASSALQTRIDALLQPDLEANDVTETSVNLPFSPFIRAHARRAAEVASELFQTADEQGLEQAVEAAERAATRESSRGLVKRAVKTFVTHHPQARRRLTLPSVEEVEGQDFAVDEQPSPPNLPEEPLPLGEIDVAAIPSRTLPVEERRIDWYREDPFANDHHAHWHDVWNTDGIEEHGGQFVTQPRQGELFLYMHQQMLARYDTERRIAGLGQTVPFEAPYSQQIAEGYGAPRYVTRPAGTTLRDVQVRPDVVVGPGDLKARHDKVDEALDAGRLDVPSMDLGPLNENQLGAAIEPSDLHLDAGSDLDLAVAAGYQNLHGLGHVLTSQTADPQQGDRWWGVMRYVETAIRDPFFYRWHRHIDDQCARFQKDLTPTKFAEHAAGVSFRGDGGADVLLAFSDQVADGDFDAFARTRLGGEQFDDPEGLATDTLTTRFRLSRVTAPIPPSQTGPGEETYWTTHLTHRPFAIFLRLEAPAAQHVTVRVFLAHQDLAGDRRMWIELDKFDRELQQGVNLVGQPDALSSVIKRKGVDAPGAAPPGNGDTWCDCGWPYTLLIPSGESSPGGSAFKLAVVVTDWTSDQAGEPTSCGSMSFCGSRRRYPDLREMGYPFNRPFPDGVLETLAAQPNVAMRDLAIRCENQRPPE
jgi:tyrosinase